MSRCTTSSWNLRPMSRLMANRVFWGLVTAWRLAGWPTSTSPSLVKATIEGVVRSPSLFSITRGLPPSMMATHELVVPRSIPITFAMSALRRQSSAKRAISRSLVWGSPPELSSLGGGLAGHNHPGRPQQPAVQLVTRLDHPEHRVRLRRGGLLRHHGLVPLRVEGLTRRIDHPDPDPLERLRQELQRRLLPLPESAPLGPPGALHGCLQAVLHRQQLRGELLEAVAVGRLDVALGALAHVVELGE